MRYCTPKGPDFDRSKKAQNRKYLDGQKTLKDTETQEP